MLNLHIPNQRHPSVNVLAQGQEGETLHYLSNVCLSIVEQRVSLLTQLHWLCCQCSLSSNVLCIPATAAKNLREVSEVRSSRGSGTELPVLGAETLEKDGDL